MHCTNCGKELRDNDKFCPSCGKENQYFNDNGYYEQNNTTYYQGNNVNKDEGNWLGILAIVFSVLGGWIGLVLSIVGLCTSQSPKERKYCKIALGISITWIIICIIWAIFIFGYFGDVINDIINNYY